MAYNLEFAQSVYQDLKQVPARYRAQILDAIKLQLVHEPTKVTRNRKALPSLIPPWDAMPPVWELRVGEYRVFYDVDERDQKVLVRAVRRKPPGKTTEEIL